MKIFAVILIVIAAYSLTLPAYAQDSDQPEPGTLILTDQQGEYPLGRYLDILEDPSGELTIEDVTSPEFENRFVRSQVDVPNYGYTDYVYWLRLKLRNDASLTHQWLLETVFQNLNYVDLYLSSGDDGFIKKESGALRPFRTREIPFYHVVFRVPLPEREEQTIYLRVESGSSMTLAFELWSPETFATEKFDELLIAGLFYGSLLIILGYHLFLYLSLKEAVYIYFVFFLTSAILFFASYEGIADQYLWPGLSQEKKYLLVITMALLFITSLRFSDVFLEQKTRVPRFHLIFNLLIGFWVLMIALLPFASFLFMAQITSIGLLVTPLLIIVAGFYAWRKRYIPARYYLISWVGFLLGILSAELVRMDALPSTPLTERSYQVGLIWLALLSSLALADRIKLLKSQTEEANRLLQVNENRLSQILEGLPLGVVVYGKDQKPSYINKRSSEILSNPSQGILPDISAGRTLAQAMDYYSFRVSGSEQLYPIESMPVQRALQGDRASADDIDADLVDRRVPLEIWASPIKDEKGGVENVVVAFQDITQRRRTEAELAEYRKQLESIVENRTAELSVVNEQLQMRVDWLSAVNLINQFMSGPAEFTQIYQKVIEIINNLFDVHGSFIAELDADSNQLKILAHSCQHKYDQDLNGTYTTHPEGILPASNLEGPYPVYLSKDQLYSIGGPMGAHLRGINIHNIALVPLILREKVYGYLGLEMQDESQQLTNEVADLLVILSTDITQLIENERLYKQSKAMIAAEERNRLARDLHDSVTQVLFSASLVAEVLPRIWKRDPETAQRSLEELQRLTRGALAEMRTLLLELRPASVIKSPLGELLAQLTEAITSRGGLQFQLFFEQTPVLPEDVHLSFYRIAQEGLNNVVKHAKASLVTVSLIATPSLSDKAEEWRGEVKLMIRDNGVGFADQAESSGHMGLNIIRERARSINADIIINSQPGSGTELILTWHN